MSRILRLIAEMTISVIAILWIPTAIGFIFVGIWGDTRWIITGFVMLALFMSVLLAWLLARIFGAATDPTPPQRHQREFWDN